MEIISKFSKQLPQPFALSTTIRQGDALSLHGGVGYVFLLLEIDIVMSSSLFMLITYYSVMTDTNEHD